MSCQLPCLLSNIEQHREIAERCPGVVLCDDTNWTIALKKLALRNREELQKEGFKNAFDVKKQFSLSSMHEKYEAIYKKAER